MGFLKRLLFIILMFVFIMPCMFFLTLLGIFLAFPRFLFLGHDLEDSIFDMIEWFMDTGLVDWIFSLGEV